MSRHVLPALAVVIAAGLAAACSGGSTPTPSSAQGRGSAPPAVTVAPTAVPSGATPSAAPSAAPSTPASVAPSAAASSPTPATSAAPASAAPASISITFGGDSSVKGQWGTYALRADPVCNNPTFNGPDIIFFAQSKDGSAVALVTLSAGSIEVSERAGAGATYTDREFQGTGVTALDPTTGATFDSDLTETTPSTNNPGTLGKFSHVSGTIECGSQTISASTVTMTGTTPDGAINGPFSAFRVSCNNSTQYGMGVNATAIVTAGTNPTMLIINLPSNGKATVYAVGKDPGTQTLYMINPADTYTVTSNSVHLDADYLQNQAAGTSSPAPLVVHLSGDLTCGAFNQSP